MDFSNRGPGVQHSMPMGPQADQPASAPRRKGKNNWSDNIVVRIVNVLMTLAVVAVLIGLLIFVIYDKNTSTTADTEGQYVKTANLQAVFLNTGQVYFGNIKAVNSNFLVLRHIFYLESNSTSSSSSSSSSTPSNVTLVKLGCEIHAPLDQMVINRSAVTFWENLSPKGQVAEAVARWDKANPNGQTCTNISSSTGTSASTGTTSK